MKKIKIFITIFTPLLCGIIVGLLTNTNLYKNIVKPPLSPPAILFPIVWLILYLLMGISLYYVIKDQLDKKAIKIFIIQLTINLIWPFTFFTFSLYYLSAFLLLVLIYYVISMITYFYSRKKIAGILQFPYFIWILFALYLNLGIALLN